MMVLLLSSQVNLDTKEVENPGIEREEGDLLTEGIETTTIEGREDREVEIEDDEDVATPPDLDRVKGIVLRVQDLGHGVKRKRKRKRDDRDPLRGPDLGRANEGEEERNLEKSRTLPTHQSRCRRQQLSVLMVLAVSQCQVSWGQDMVEEQRPSPVATQRLPDRSRLLCRFPR